MKDGSSRILRFQSDRKKTSMFVLGDTKKVISKSYILFFVKHIKNDFGGAQKGRGDRQLAVSEPVINKAAGKAAAAGL